MKRHASQASSDDANVPKAAPPITKNDDLSAILTQYQNAEFLAVDTEFLRERTYYPQLCLIQISDGVDAVAIDPLAPNLDLNPLWDLMRNQKITKVFHAGNQDMEIFLHLMGSLPAPIYDTQIAAMAVGLGDSISYDNLVGELLGRAIDKGSRFTDVSAIEAVKLDDLDAAAAQAGYAEAKSAYDTASDDSAEKAEAQIAMETYAAVADALGLKVPRSLINAISSAHLGMRPCLTQQRERVLGTKLSRKSRQVQSCCHRRRRVRA